MKYNAIICGMLCIFHFTVAEFVVNLYLTCAFLQFMYHMIMQAQLLVLHPSAVLCPAPIFMPCPATRQAGTYNMINAVDI